MANVKIHKVASLPSIWDVNAVYFVKIGTVVTTYVTDNVGTPYLASTSIETDPVYTASVPNQMMYKGVIPGSVNLNTYATTGKYLQNSDANAASGTNYPVARAGELEVTNLNNGEFYMQKYHAYNSYGYYQRSLYTASGAWSAWTRYVGDNEAVTFGVNTSGNLMNGYPGNSVLYSQSASDAPAAGIGFVWNAALNNVSGIYSAQMFIGANAGTGVNPDQFWFRNNQQGGPGWPGPWLQVATRQWANTATILNQNAVIQSANFRINGYAQVGTGMEVGNYMGVYGDYADGSIYINPHTITCARSGNNFTLFEFQGAGVGSVFNTMSSAPFKFRYNNDPDRQMMFDQNLMIGVTDAYVSTGERLQVNGSIRQTAVTSTMIKVDSTGKIVAATAGTDYLATGSVIQNQTATTQAAGFKIDGAGESTTTLAAPTVKANTVQPYSGSTLTLSASLLKISNMAGGVANRAVVVDGTGSATAGPVLESGTYTPTVTGDATFTVQGFTYQRIGNIVSVMGRLVCSAISSSTMSASITLPIASNLDNAYDLIGTVTGSGIAAAPNLIIADGSTNKALLTAATSGGLSAVVYLSFQYQILP